MLKKTYSRKIFLVHFCLFIPILLISLIASYFISDRIGNVEKREMTEQLNDMLGNLEENYADYYEDAVLLSEHSELLPYKVQKNWRNALKGIEILRLKGYFDSQISNVFLRYGTNMIYSSAGVSSIKIHFESILRCDEESVSRGIDLLEKGTNSVIFLFSGEADGYILYNYATRRVGEEFVSVNFAVSFKDFLEQLSILRNSEIYEINASDGSKLLIGNNEHGKLTIYPADYLDKLQDNNKYNVLETTSETIGLQVKMYYQPLLVIRDNGLYELQLVNIGLLALSVMLSAIISGLFTKRRINEILRLERIAEGTAEHRFSADNVYSRLQNTIESGLSGAKKLEKQIQEHVIQLRDKTANMVFHGLVRDMESLKSIFQELGLNDVPKYYYVGALYANADYKKVQLPETITERMHTRITCDFGECIVFLYELHNLDDNRIARKKLAETVKKNLHEQNVHKVRIGMSQVYSDALRIDCALNEAISVLEVIISGRHKDFCACWENTVKEVSFLLPDSVLLRNFREALKKQGMEEILKWLYKIMQEYSVKECSEENKIFIRYSILQCLVEYLSESNSLEKMVLLKECLNMEITEEKAFTQGMLHVLSHCTIKKENDNFAKMLDYIEENYHRSDLIYEDVAKAGGVTKTYVSKLFRQRLGISYVEYLTTVRLDRACTLLRTTSMSIGDVANAVGYENTASFRRIFKGKYSVSAAEYRKREKEGL